jgi:GT2 family glycosyltransferase
MLTVSMVVHQNFGFIEQALSTLYISTSLPLETYVIINAGEKSHVATLKSQFPQVHYIINDTPQGFAANHNMILRLARTDFIALLNDDILIHEHALDILVDYLQSHPDTGVAGPLLRNGDGTQQVSVYSDPRLLRSMYRVSGFAVFTSQNSKLRRVLIKSGLLRGLKVESLKFDNRARPVPIVKGAAMVIRRAAYEQVGGMDETTRAYGEEADWHWRFREAGWQIAFVPEAVITHFGAGQANLQLRGWVLVEDRKAILYYYLKHRPSYQALLIRLTIVLSHFLWTLLWLLFDRKRASDHLQVVKMALSFRYRGEI